MDHANHANPEVFEWLKAIQDDKFLTDKEWLSAEVLCKIADPSYESHPQYFRHVDGGIYYLINTAENANDNVCYAVYYHLWPFEAKRWTRPMDEWNLRFSPISSEEARKALSVDQEEAQRLVMDNKAKRRAAEKAVKIETWSLEDLDLYGQKEE